MVKQKDMVTEMAKAGLAIQEMFGEQINEVTQAPVMTSDDLADLYLQANFEQRYQMFTEILSSQGADGLQLLGDVFRKAQEIYGGEE